MMILATLLVETEGEYNGFVVVVFVTLDAKYKFSNCSSY